MAEIVGRKDSSSGSVPQESPLVRNNTMQQMYAGMVESRILEELAHAGRRKAKGTSVHGQEACRVSALVDLEPEDLTSDVPGSVTTAFVRGVELQDVLEHIDAISSGKKKAHKASELHLAGLLPSIDDTGDRLQMALGAALALKRNHLPKVVVAFAPSHAVKTQAWREVFRFASRHELPILFVALPETNGKAARGKKLTTLGERAISEGVPGIAVDSSDAVALYRVAQESIGRARMGAGPTLMECVTYRLEGQKEGQKKNEVFDPIPLLGQTLLRRQVCSEEWLARAATSFQARIDKP
jgi:TPP-dependent pyruvate/acetoin dehydrogenase alpha subunit